MAGMKGITVNTAPEAESGWEEGDKIVQTWTLTDDPVYPEPELSAEEALNIIMGVVQ